MTAKTVIDIERLLIWTYQDQAADVVSRRIAGAIGPGQPVSNMAVLERQNMLGVRVDCSRAVGSSRDLHPDAEAVHEEVLQLPPTEVGLVISHAKGGTRPDWVPDTKLRAVPVLRSNGKPKMELAPRRNVPVLCLIRYVPDPHHVEFQREVYRTWWDALTALVSNLGDLSSHCVVGPGFGREPWFQKVDI